jgi:Uma2 family endonuclease
LAISLRLAARPTDEEILGLSERNPGLQIEQDASGELILAPIGAEGSRREVELAAQLHRWAKAEARGIVFGPSAGFRLPDGSLRSPDASWVHRQRWEALTPSQREGFAPLCPEAVFEIRSRSDALRDVRAKMRTYLANGARIAVLIDPQRRAVEIFAPDQDPQVFESAQSASFDPVLPGFALDLRPIFE